uniref:Uncharacterized protein n=1 Tax=Anguilla anguilla TaxID=7936 RepID=A0A0E9PDU2_ANGAN
MVLQSTFTVNYLQTP